MSLLDLRSLWERLPAIATPGAASLALTTFAPTIATPRVVTPGVASLVLTRFAPTVATPRLCTPATAALILTRFAPTVATPVTIIPAKASLILATFAPAVTATQSGTKVVTPATAILTLKGFAPTLPDLVLGSPGGYGAGNLIQFPDEDHFAGPPYRQPHDVEDQPLEVPDITPVLPLVAKADNRPAIIALYESHAIDEDTFVALLAAA